MRLPGGARQPVDYSGEVAWQPSRDIVTLDNHSQYE
jgi:hypothetical protein